MELPDIVKRALVETVTDIGQLSRADLYQLNKYVKRGWLSKGLAGPFPRLKTVYACPGFDFVASRERYVEQAMRLAELDRARRESGCGCGKRHQRAVRLEPGIPNAGAQRAQEPRAGVKRMQGKRREATKRFWRLITAITDFLTLKSISRKDAATALTVLREFKGCESTEEWLAIPFSAWAKLEQLEEFLDHMVNNVPLKDDTIAYMAAHKTATTTTNPGDGEE